MMALLVFREKLRAFYGKYDGFVIPLIKFSLSMAVFFLLNSNVGYMARLKSPVILVGVFVPALWGDLRSGGPDPGGAYQQRVCGDGADPGGPSFDGGYFILWISAGRQLSAFADAYFFPA